EPLELFRNAEDQFVMVAHANHDGRGPGTDIGLEAAARFVVLPDLRAGLFIHSQQELALTRSAPQDGQIAVENWRRRISPDVFHLAQRLPPELLAVEIVAEHAGGTEADHHSFAISHGRGRAEGVLAVAGFVVREYDLLLPEFLAVGSVQTPEHSVRV